MNLRFYIFVGILLLTCSFRVCAQREELKLAQRYYLAEEYEQALDMYANVDKYYKLKFSELPTEHQICIATANFQVQRFRKSVVAFAQIGDKLSGDNAYVYAKALVRCGMYEDALKWFDKCKKGVSAVGIMQVIVEMESCKWALQNRLKDGDEVFCELKESDVIDVKGKSLGVFACNDGVYYSKAKHVGEEEVWKIYKSESKDGELVKGTESEVDVAMLNVDLSAGQVVIAEGGDIMYFTKSRMNESGEIFFKIYAAHKNENGGWNRVEQLDFTKDEYNYGFASLSGDGNYLLFASDRKGGFGGMDIWMVELLGPVSFGVPQNLGGDVNSYGDEIYPQVLPDGKLYFTSNGKNGFGGYDIYVSEYSNSRFGNVRNMMMPMNSSGDDFAFVMSAENMSKGFVSSNRKAEDGYDRVYEVTLRDPMKRVGTDGLKLDKKERNITDDKEKGRINGVENEGDTKKVRKKVRSIRYF